MNTTDKEVKYLLDGQEVEVQRAVEGGFLVKRRFDFPTEDEEFALGDVEFVEKVFDVAPTEKLSKAIEELARKKDELLAEVEKIRQLKGEENSTLKKISLIPNMQMVVDYLSGDFKFVFRPDIFDIADATRTYNSKNICVEMVKGEVRLGVLNSEHFGSDRRTVLVFQKEEDAKAERKKQFISRIQSIRWKYDLSQLMAGYHVKDLASDEDVKAVVAARLDHIQKESQREKIQSEKKAIEDNQKILNDMSAKP